MEVCHLESKLSSSEKINALNHSLFEVQKENMEAKVTQAEAKAAEANVKAESLETENTALAEKLNAAGQENVSLCEHAPWSHTLCSHSFRFLLRVRPS